MVVYAFTKETRVVSCKKNHAPSRPATVYMKTQTPVVQRDESICVLPMRVTTVLITPENAGDDAKKKDSAKFDKK